MAEPLKRDNLKWEEQLAAISNAGVRPLVIDSLAVGGGAEGTYTVAGINTKRVVIIHESTGSDLDIRFDLGATAVATGFPIAAGVYFVVEAEKDEVLHFFNTTGGSVTIHIMEIR